MSCARRRRKKRSRVLGLNAIALLAPCNELAISVHKLFATLIGLVGEQIEGYSDRRLSRRVRHTAIKPMGCPLVRTQILAQVCSTRIIVCVYDRVSQMLDVNARFRIVSPFKHVAGFAAPTLKHASDATLQWLHEVPETIYPLDNNQMQMIRHDCVRQQIGI